MHATSLYKRLFFLFCWLSSPQRVALFYAMTGSKVRTPGSIQLQYSIDLSLIPLKLLNWTSNFSFNTFGIQLNKFVSQINNNHSVINYHYTSMWRGYTLNILFSLFSTIIIMAIRVAFLISNLTARLTSLLRMPSLT